MSWIIAVAVIAAGVFILNTLCDEMRRADARDDAR